MPPDDCRRSELRDERALPDRDRFGELLRWPMSDDFWGVHLSCGPLCDHFRLAQLCRRCYLSYSAGLADLSGRKSRVHTADDAGPGNLFSGALSDMGRCADLSGRSRLRPHDCGDAHLPGWSHMSRQPELSEHRQLLVQYHVQRCGGNHL